MLLQERLVRLGGDFNEANVRAGHRPSRSPSPDGIGECHQAGSRYLIELPDVTIVHQGFDNDVRNIVRIHERLFCRACR